EQLLMDRTASSALPTGPDHHPEELAYWVGDAGDTSRALLRCASVITTPGTR
ncbi:MAG: hypothetical protein QOK30_2060, partial [Nocardioidaceae bacterium]|nr:hypothetical protein [Nocardioidaceae bacterium]